MKKEQIIEACKENNVRYIKLMITDLLGTVKSIEISVNKLEDALEGKILFDGSSIEGFVRIKEADMYLHPDLDTFAILPLDNKDEIGRTARIICDVYTASGVPFEGDPRGVLKRALAKLKEFGIARFNIGVEPEFYLLRKEGERLVYSDNGSYFDMAPIGSDESIRHEIVMELEKLGYEVEISHHEVGPGQNEVNFRFDDALKTCDRIQTYKQIVKQVAARHNLIATFMPKPFEGKPGNGMHVNCSLADESGANLFYDPEGEHKLSKLCINWINGILLHAREMSSITNPIINSYKRLVPGYEAPCYICWSDANRSSMIRIPAVKGLSTRTEVRNVDPYANPYLMAASILLAGLDGIKNELDSIPAVSDNIFEMSREEREAHGIKNLPENLKDAIKELKKSPFMKEVLGEHIYKKYILAKEIEWQEYRVLVTKRELNRYL